MTHPEEDVTAGGSGGADEVHAAFITDDGYAAVTATAVASLKASRRPGGRCHAWVVAVGVSAGNAEKLEQLAGDGFAVTVVAPDERYTRLRLNIGGYCAVTDYVRLYIAELLPQLDRVLYLDDDVIVRGDLSGLYGTDLAGLYCAACRDMWAETCSPSVLEGLHSGLPCYFNAGVMLLNLRKMREDRVTEKLVDYVLHGINFMGNQDAFNVVFGGKVRYVSCEWNMITGYLRERPPEEIAGYYGLDGVRTEARLLERARILHFAGPGKPWESYQYFFTDLYLSYFRMGPYGGGALPPRRDGRRRETLFLFPYGVVGRGSRVALYGAGAVGRDYLEQVLKTGYCSLAAWADSAWGTAEGYEYGGTVYRAGAPEGLAGGDAEYDVCVIAVLKEEAAGEIRARLLDMGVPEEKIFWQRPQWVSVGR